MNCFSKAKALRDGRNAKDNAKAKAYFEKALELDPACAWGCMYLADTDVVDLWLGRADKDAPLIVNEAEPLAWCGYGFLLLGQHEKRV